MRFYPGLWQEFENFPSLSDHSRAALRRHELTNLTLFVKGCPRKAKHLLNLNLQSAAMLATGKEKITHDRFGFGRRDRR
jgi:hypothetical protein